MVVAAWCAVVVFVFSRRCVCSSFVDRSVAYYIISNQPVLNNDQNTGYLLCYMLHGDFKKKIFFSTW